jgi:hypothetical protein
MPSALLAQGATLDRPQKNAPIHINRFFTGLWTNRSPLREGAVEYLLEKFYSGSRFDSVYGGQNTELTPKLTWARRPGLSVYNSQTFTAPNTFYEFRITDPNTGIESIRVIVDTPTAVYDGTGPNTKTLLLSKGAGSGQTSFQSVGNTLYMGDGVDTKQWLWFPAWVANQVYALGDCILDPSGNIWQSQGLSLQVVSTSVASDVLTVVYSGGATVNVGDQWTFVGMTSNPSLNGITVTVATIGVNSFTASYSVPNYGTDDDTGVVFNSSQSGTSGSTLPNFAPGSDILNVVSTSIVGGFGTAGAVINVSGSPSPALAVGQAYVMSNLVYATWFNGNTLTIHQVLSANSFKAFFSHPAYSATADTGNATLVQTTTVILDGSVAWVFKGYSVRDWGIPAATVAPSVSNVFAPLGNAWVASTYWWPAVPGITNNAIILDPNGNIQLLTVVGTTHSSVPSFSTVVGHTTTDGSATWTCQGTGTRATSSVYTVGQWIAVTVTTQTKYIIGYEGGTRSPIDGGGTPGNIPVYGYKYITNFLFFVCTTAGTSSSTATASIAWASGLGGTTTDGNVIWTNAGYQITRTSSGSASPTYNTAGNVGDSQIVTNISSIDDAVSPGGGSGFIQAVSVAGASASTPPTWATASSVEQAGLITTETSGLQWTNGGPAGVANTGTWVYAYSFGDSITNHEGTASPLSVPILEAANSAISISGNGDPKWATDFSDIINIYRSVQGSSVPFRLTSIPAPANGGSWSYVDTSPDPPNPLSILNELISPDLTGTNAPPPTNLIGLTYHLGRIFGISDEFVVYSQTSGEEVGVGVDSWSAENFFQMPSTPVVNWPSAAGLFIYTNSSIWLSSGLDNNGNPLAPILFLDQTGILSPNAFAVNGSTPFIFASDSTNEIQDPASGVQYTGIPIANLLQAFSAPGSYVTWHSFGIDQGFYVADGSTGWYRLALLSPPETGYAWCTKANIVGGCKCVKSVETSPGVRQLLIGPAMSGPILFRDLTTNADNGTPFPANTIIGSIVLAQPNQCAEVVSVTSECTAVGSRPTIGILADEISGTFENLQIKVNDPPYLESSQSLYADRWYFDQLETPAWMRHLMLNFAWPEENQANELLTYSLFGSVHTEG